MTTKTFTKDEIKDLKVGAIARKHKCSEDYVRRVLTGDRERNSELSKKILIDVVDIFKVLERETIVM